MKYYIGRYDTRCDTTFIVIGTTMDSVAAHFILGSYLELNKNLQFFGFVYKMFSEDKLPKNWIYSNDEKEDEQ